MELESVVQATLLHKPFKHVPCAEPWCGQHLSSLLGQPRDICNMESAWRPTSQEAFFIFLLFYC